jgi:hypothetical protein
MNLITTIARLVDDPGDFIVRTDGRETGWAGMAGYAVGVFSLFVFLRMFSAVPPGVYSFLNILLAAAAVNFLFAAAVHLFLEMTGAKGGRALTLFFLFGVTELLWIVLIPLGLLANLDLLNPAVDLLICCLAIIAARIALVRRLYAISRNKALLALGLPYAALAAASFAALIYAVVYLVWFVS